MSGPRWSSSGRDTHLALEPCLNPKFVAMLAEELIAYLNRRTANFADAVLLFAAREHRLVEAEELVRAGDDERMDMLWDEIRAREA